MPPATAVNPARQWDRLMTLARLGAIPGDGVNRPCLSALDREARRHIIAWAREVGATVSIDAAANLFLRREGSDPAAAAVLTGSHMDSQPEGGRFDGIYGVVAGLEAITALHHAGITTSRAIEVVAWTNEEGGRFAPGCMGSMAWSGHSPLSTWSNVKDPQGITFATALADHLAAEADLPCRPLGSRPHAYLEAHIEQGPILEAENTEIGIVTGIQGSRWFTVTITGASAHAGTAPVGRRQDPVQDMLRAIAALNAVMADPTDTLRFTVGRIDVLPNTSNTVASQARFSIDLRHPDRDTLLASGDAIRPTIAAALKTCRATVDEHFHAMPVAFAPLVIDAVAQSAAALGHTARRLPSGAFHDAQFVAPIAPTGMLFVPSRAGISHNPAEYTSPEHLAAGTRVLTEALTRLAS